RLRRLRRRRRRRRGVTTAREPRARGIGFAAPPGSTRPRGPARAITTPRRRAWAAAASAWRRPPPHATVARAGGVDSAPWGPPQRRQSPRALASQGPEESETGNGSDQPLTPANPGSARAAGTVRLLS